MNTLKRTLLSLLMASAMAVISTSALAETDAGRATYKPAEAIDIVATRIQAAIDAISKGANSEEATKSLTSSPGRVLGSKVFFLEKILIVTTLS